MNKTCKVKQEYFTHSMTTEGSKEGLELVHL
jgi:hypothetical protein